MRKLRMLLLLVMSGSHYEVPADGMATKEAPSHAAQCEEPPKPISRDQLRKLALAELSKRGDTAHTEIEINWGRNTCAWQVIATRPNPGPGEHVQLIFSNAGKLLLARGGY